MNAEEIAPPPDFFITYTGVNTNWAVWIAWCLEEEGYIVVLQAWDFRPGHNFPLMMNMAARARHTIAVISRAYLEASFVQPEWASAFRSDPTGMRRKLIPVRIEDCELDALLSPIVHIDLFGCQLDDARTRLLDGIKEGRAKPASPPPFPGTLT